MKSNTRKQNNPLTSPTLATLLTSFITRFANAFAVFVAALFLVASCIACNGFGTGWLGGSRGFRWRVNTHKRKLEYWGIDWQQCLAEINHQPGKLTFITFVTCGRGTGDTGGRWSWRVNIHAQVRMLRNIICNLHWRSIINVIASHLPLAGVVVADLGVEVEDFTGEWTYKLNVSNRLATFNGDQSSTRPTHLFHVWDWRTWDLVYWGGSLESEHARTIWNVEERRQTSSEFKYPCYYLTSFSFGNLNLLARSLHAALVGFANFGGVGVSARFLLQLPDYEVTPVASLEQLQNG